MKEARMEPVTITMFFSNVSISVNHYVAATAIHAFFIVLAMQLLEELWHSFLKEFVLKL